MKRPLKRLKQMLKKVLKLKNPAVKPRRILKFQKMALMMDAASGAGVDGAVEDVVAVTGMTSQSPPAKMAKLA